MQEKRASFTLEKEWLRTTHCYGFTHVMNEHHPVWLRVFWTVSIITCASLMMYQLCCIFDNYLAYPVVTDVSIETDPVMPFPAVTMCNLNRLTEEGVNRWLERVNEPSANKALLKAVLWQATNVYQPSLVLSSVVAKMQLFSEATRTLLNSTTLDDLYAVAGQNASDTYCTWLGDAVDLQHSLCPPADVLASTNVLGNCITFNANGTRKASHHGTYSGVAMASNERPGLLLPSSSDQSGPQGFVLLVHSPRVPPWWITAGYMIVAPGSHNLISLELVELEMLPPPYGVCDDSDATYAVEKCELHCWAQAIVHECACALSGFDAAASVRKCTLLDHLSCVNSAFLRSRAQTCACPPPCFTADFKPKLSSGKKAASRGGVTDVVVDVHFEQKTKTRVTQMQGVTMIDVLSSVGGQCAFFMGMSVVTLVEVIVYVLRRGITFVETDKPTAVASIRVGAAAR